MTYALNGHRTPSRITSLAFSTASPQVRRLRVRRGMALLYMAGLTFAAALFLASDVRLAGAAAVLLFIDVCLIAAFRKPFDPLSAIGRKGVVPLR